MATDREGRELGLYYDAPSWADYKDFIYKYYITLDWTDRDRWLFRGQADSKWSLQPTLDRELPFPDAPTRFKYMDALADRFIQEAAAHHRREELDAIEWEMLAQHHGLPTRMLDWTQSPYIAAFFAFDQLHRINPSPTHVSIWGLHKDIIAHIDDGILDIPKVSWSKNPRARCQRAEFTILLSALGSIDSAISGTARRYLIRVDIPTEEASLALADLDEMSISATTLFPDLEGASRSVRRRMGNNISTRNRASDD